MQSDIRHAESALRLLSCPFHLTQTIVADILKWRQRLHSRDELRMLNDHDLWDIGLTHCAAQAETRKHFWQE